MYNTVSYLGHSGRTGILLAVCLCVAATLFAAPAVETATEPDITITVVGVGVTGETYQGIYDRLIAKYPYITIETRESDLKTGEDVTMTALLAVGDPPDIYTDFVGRAGKYVTPKFAMALDINPDEWVTELIAPYKRGGVLYALPQTIPAQGMAVNLSLLDSIGYELPEGDTWTIAEFMEMCQAVKDADIEDTYGTGLFGAHPSADYLWVNWFAAFGVTSMFADDYTRSRADEPQFLDTWRFFDTLMGRGYIHPNSALWGVSPDFLQAIGKGTMAAYGSRMGWPGGMQNNFNKDGEHYEWTVRSFPSVSGERVATLGAGHIVIGHKTEYEPRRVVVNELVQAMSSYDLQHMWTRKANVPTRTGIPPGDEMGKGEQYVVDLANTVGMLDVGYPNPWYYETRSAAPPILAALLKGEITPEEAHRLYFETITEIINK